MPVKEYSMKIRIRGEKLYLEDFKKKLKESIVDEIGPELYKAAKEIFLYKKMPDGIVLKWGEFMAAHAGILSAALIENFKKNLVNMGSQNTFVTADRDGLLISAGTTEAASKKFEEQSKSMEAIMKIITNLDDQTAERIFKQALQDADWD
jgi:hypothetical protein